MLFLADNAVFVCTVDNTSQVIIAINTVEIFLKFHFLYSYKIHSAIKSDESFLLAWY